MAPLTHGSLFAGIGGIDLGFERAGIDTVWQVEIDDYATGVLEKHWPDVRRWRDVRTFPPDDTWPTPDIISGGFPCQDLSVAGKQAGLDADRSGLWWEMLRVVRVLRPRIVVVENVPNLLSGDGGSWARTFFGSLAESGYDAEWDCIPACFLGAPHRRVRVFVVAHGRGVLGKRPCPLLASDSSTLDAWGSTSKKWGTYREEPSVGTTCVHRLVCSWKDVDSESSFSRMVDGLPGDVHRIRCLGNAVVPQVAEWIGRRIVEAEDGGE